MVCMNGTASSHLPPCASASDKACRWRSNGFPKRTTTMSLVYPKESLSVYPKHLSPKYRSTVKRSPSKPLIIVPHTLSELTGPAFGHDAIQENDNDLTKQHKGEPLGERIIVHGRVLDEDKRPVSELSLIHISEPTRLLSISYAVFCLKKKKKK